MLQLRVTSLDEAADSLMSQAPRRIAFLIHSLGLGGAERNTARLANRFTAEGWEVLVITSAERTTDVFHLASGIERHVLTCHRASGSRAGPWSFVCRLREIRSTLTGFEPEALVCMMTTANILGTLSATGLPIRVIISERNFPGRPNVRFPWRILRRFVYRRADHFVAQTFVGARWVEDNLGIRDASIIPNAVTLPIAIDRSRPCPEPDREGPSLILAVGTKPHQKGFDLLLKAVTPLLLREPSWSLVVLGIDRATLLSQMPEAKGAKERDIRLLDQIHALGEVGNPGEWYRAAQVFVLSSRYEGFPNALVEAMASGCACVAFSCPTGPEEIIDDHRNGFLLPNGDVAALSTAIHGLMIDDEERRRLGSAAREVLARYSDTRVFDRWLSAVSVGAAQEESAPC